MLQPLAAVALAALLVAAASSAPQTNASEDVRFRWAFAARTGPEGARKLARVTDDVTLRSGDEIRMLVGPVTSCFVYLVHEDPAGAIVPLFPDAGGAFPASYQPGALFDIPSSGDWLRLDDATGIERIYLTASSARLPRLEAALKRGSRAELIAELSALRSRYAKADWVERPVQIGGLVRGHQAPDIRSMVTEIAAKAFFSRVFVIDHR